MVQSKSFAIGVASLVLLANVGWCQNDIQNYPWRANNQSAVKVVQPHQLPHAASGTVASGTVTPIVPANTVASEMPTPPKVGLNVVTNRLQDQQVPEGQKYDFEAVPQVPAADTQTGVYESVVSDPALSVQSNANDTSPNYCYRDCRPQWCNLGCQKRLFPRPIAGFDVQGFAQFGYHNRDILPFNNRRRQFSPHQVWLSADKTEFIRGLPLRWRADAVYGLDAQEFQAIGNTPNGAPEDWDNEFDHDDFGWAIPQAFVETNLGGWDVRMGKFLSPFGYEAAPATENFFYSRTYTRAFTEPFTHTGVLAHRNNGASTQIFGVTAGWDTAFESNSSGFNVITGMGFQLGDFTRITTTSSFGDTGYRGSGILSSAIAEVQLASKVSYVGQVDILNLQDNNEFGFVNNLFYCHNRCLALGARLEWWKSNQFQAETASTYDFTVGANYRPRANILVRPEVRWDWGANAIDNGEVIFGLDTIITF